MSKLADFSHTGYSHNITFNPDKTENILQHGDTLARLQLNQHERDISRINGHPGVSPEEIQAKTERHVRRVAQNRNSFNFPASAATALRAVIRTELRTGLSGKQSATQLASLLSQMLRQNG